MTKAIKRFILKRKYLHGIVRLYIRYKAARKGMGLGPFTGREGLGLAVRRGRDLVVVSDRHLPYALDAVTNFDYYFDSVVAEERDGLRVADFSGLGLHRLRQCGEEFWFSSFPETEVTIELYLRYAGLNSGSVAIDCGAYCGVSAIFLARQAGPAGKVYALEPDPRNYECLQRNIRRHHADNIVALPVGIWSEPGSIQFEAEGNLGSSLTGLAGREGNVISVEVISFDGLVNAHGLERVDFVKMDIEGAELAVILASESFFKKFRPILIIESHYTDGVLTAVPISAALAKYGYAVEILPQGELELPLLLARPKPLA